MDLVHVMAMQTLVFRPKRRIKTSRVWFMENAIANIAPGVTIVNIVWICTMMFLGNLLLASKNTNVSVSRLESLCCKNYDDFTFDFFQNATVTTMLKNVTSIPASLRHPETGLVESVTTANTTPKAEIANTASKASTKTAHLLMTLMFANVSK